VETGFASERALTFQVSALSPDLGTRGIMLQSLQSVLSFAFCAAGAVIIVVGNRQFRMRDINNIPIVSPRAKHVVGIFLILAAIVIFLSQFLADTRKGGRPSLRRPMLGITELQNCGATVAIGHRRGCQTVAASRAKTTSA
jgi:hypothetical protein